jgi:hypothetical protein
MTLCHSQLQEDMTGPMRAIALTGAHFKSGNSAITDATASFSRPGSSQGLVGHDVRPISAPRSASLEKALQAFSASIPSGDGCEISALGSLLPRVNSFRDAQGPCGSQVSCLAQESAAFGGKQLDCPSSAVPSPTSPPKISNTSFGKPPLAQGMSTNLDTAASKSTREDAGARPCTSPALDANKIAGSWTDIVLTAYMYLRSHHNGKDVTAEAVAGVIQTI